MLCRLVWAARSKSLDQNGQLVHHGFQRITLLMIEHVGTDIVAVLTELAPPVSSVDNFVRALANELFGRAEVSTVL